MSDSYKITGSTLYVTLAAAENTEVMDINETLSSLDEFVGDTVFQLFDADKVADRKHIYYAAANAYYAMENGGNISNNLQVETLLYASTQDQISRAINMIGVSKATKRIAVAVISETEQDPAAEKIAEFLGDVNPEALGLSVDKFEALKKLYDISDLAVEAVGGDKLDALTGLITEKGTLIGLRR